MRCSRYEFFKLDEDYSWEEDGLEDRMTTIDSLKQLFEDFAGLTVDMTLDERESTEEESEDTEEELES